MSSITEPAATQTDTFDPVTFSVVLNRFNAIANEMTLTLEQSAWTPILALCRDFSCAIYDFVPRQICMYDALPIHTTSLRIVLNEIARTFEGRIEDGDIFICNDPYRGNTHVGDVVTAMPVFAEDRHLFWTVTKGHQLDIGAYLPSSVVASARNVWQEGLTIPPVKIYERGNARDDVIDLYLSNVRYRDLLHGDLLAQLGSIRKGHDRLIELCGEYGADQIEGYVDEIISYADRRMSEQLARIPDGEYEGECWVDSDGANTFNIPIHVKVAIEGDRAIVDYTGSGPQGEGSLNGSYATSQAAGAVPFLNYIDPDIPHNEGCIQHVEVTTPEGTICNARYPASTSSATIVPSDAMQDAVNKAMAAAAPELVIAGSARCGNVPQFSGVDPTTGKAWGAMLFNNTGAQGASRGTDGWPLYESSAAAGGLKAQSIEQLELLYPFTVEYMEIEPDSMGLGQWIGGPGVRMVIAPNGAEMECITFGDGCANPPHGVLGGTPGIGGGQYTENRATGSRNYVTASGHIRIGPDEIYVGVSTGGGGYGNPADRQIEQVRRDVRDGIISREAARSTFGIHVTEAFDPAVCHEEDTDKLRPALKGGANPLVNPVQAADGPDSRWVETDRRPGDNYLVNPTL